MVGVRKNDGEESEVRGKERGVTPTFFLNNGGFLGFHKRVLGQQI